MILELIGSGVFVLWFSIFAVVATIVSLEVKSEGWATTFVSLALALVGWNYWETIWSFVSANLGTTALFLLGYIVVGLIWSFLKWNEYVKSVFRQFKEIYAKFIKKHKEFNDSTKNTLVDKIQHLHDGYLSYNDIKTLGDVHNAITPEGAKNKASIVAWISYWPLSVIGTLLNNPLRRLFEYVYSLSSGLYDKISLSHRAKLLEK